MYCTTERVVDLCAAVLTPSLVPSSPICRFCSRPFDQNQPLSVASDTDAAVVVHSGISAKRAGKAMLWTGLWAVLVLLLLVSLLCVSLAMMKEAAIVVCLAFAGPALTQPIY